MAPHSSTLAWKIPWTEEPGTLQSMGLLRVGHDWSDFTLTFHFHALEKEMATHSRVLAWRIPGTGVPGGLLSMGSHRIRHDWNDLAAAAAYQFMFPSMMLEDSLFCTSSATLDICYFFGTSHCDRPCLKNPVDRGGWWAVVQRVTESQTQLSD